MKFSKVLGQAIVIRGLTMLPENKISALETASKDDLENRLDVLAIAISAMTMLPENNIGALGTTSKDDLENRLTAVGDGKGTTSSRIRGVPNDVRDVAKVVAKKRDLNRTMRKYRRYKKLKMRLAIAMMILSGFALTSFSAIISIGIDRL